MAGDLIECSPAATFLKGPLDKCTKRAANLADEIQIVADIPSDGRAAHRMAGRHGPAVSAGSPRLERLANSTDITEMVLNEVKSDDMGERLSANSLMAKAATRRRLAGRFGAGVGAAGQDRMLSSMQPPQHMEKRDERAAGQPKSDSAELDRQRETVKSVFASRLLSRELASGRNISPDRFSHFLLSLNITNPSSGQVSNLESWLKSDRAQKAMSFMHFG